jgi:DNA-binding NarL/FixJ family response regulator
MRTLLVLDDHQAIIEYLNLFLQIHFANVKVIKSKTIEYAKVILDESVVDFVICDLQIKSGKSMVIPELCSTRHIPFMVYSSHVNFSLYTDLKRLGVNSYVSKASDLEFLKNGISCLFNGQFYVCPLVNNEAKLESTNDSPRPILSEAEKRMIKAYSDGLTTNQVAEKLFLQPVTIRNHRARAIEKNGCSFQELLLRFNYWEGT